jgi:hypothetical protein
VSRALTGAGSKRLNIRSDYQRCWCEFVLFKRRLSKQKNAPAAVWWAWDQDIRTSASHLPSLPSAKAGWRRVRTRMLRSALPDRRSLLIPGWRARSPWSRLSETCDRHSALGALARQGHFVTPRAAMPPCRQGIMNGRLCSGRGVPCAPSTDTAMRATRSRCCARAAEATLPRRQEPNQLAPPHRAFVAECPWS